LLFVLTLGVERVTNYFNNPRTVIPSLDLANGSQRQQRSERRESCILLMSALLARVDLASLRVGIPTAKGFMNYTVDYLALDTGMGQKRVERALSDLKAAGIVTVTQINKKQKDGSYMGFAAIKKLSKSLFSALGLGVMLKKERKKASQRQEEKEWEKEHVTRTSKERAALFMAAMMNSFTPIPKRHEKKDEALEYQKRLQSTALELKQKNPDWNTQKCFYEAGQLLSGP
jgi:DNA-binding transcriptional ArsR family regulator